ncbi:hypothetical protein [Pseudalkalibacillus caeni]|uniref:Uncharacterized protein n=1 Tax=Exobacillus caeni TaxID=2574798 RepID=A0A5R9F4E9_9BACL|nr:hypothetical protein [Pseudalkalibacillus caeni]TLS36518.1 hypothetical protein FCL54_14995 [Pseudalkalibacillus caeni]
MVSKLNRLYEIETDLNRLQKAINDNEKTFLPLMRELFPVTFMQKYTKFSSIDSFLEESPWDFSSKEAFEDLADHYWDEFINENTDFNSWEEMMTVGLNKWLNKKAEHLTFLIKES